jgi:hypothetical protein
MAELDTDRVMSKSRAREDATERFEALPRRVFLDSSTVQTLFRYGEAVFEGQAPPLGDRAYAIPGFADDLRALEMIFAVNERAGFEFPLSPNSLDEVAAKGDPLYTRWGLDLHEHWLVSVEEYRGAAFNGIGEASAHRLDGPSFGYLSTKDRLLLRDALLLECDAFLTMEHRLARNASHIAREVDLFVLRPPEYWRLVAPWGALYR